MGRERFSLSIQFKDRYNFNLILLYFLYLRNFSYSIYLFTHFMLEHILDLIELIKYILIGVGGVGAIMLIAGLYRRNSTFITRGGYMLIMAIILWVCGYFILSATVDRTQQRIEDIYIQY